MKFMESLEEGTFKGKILISGDAHGEIPEKKIREILEEKEGVEYYLGTGDGCYMPKGLVGDPDPHQFLMAKRVWISHEYPLHDRMHHYVSGEEFRDVVKKNRLFLAIHGHTHDQGIWKMPEEISIDRFFYQERVKEREVLLEKGWYRLNPGCVYLGQFAIVEFFGMESKILIKLYPV